jgi:HPt (histidine-containing phosphotransfer) domain-containing protein
MIPWRGPANAVGGVNRPSIWRTHDPGMTQLNDSRTGLIDGPHLDRQTMGDARLAAELLGMFVMQLDAASRELTDADPQRRIAIAHALKGTARSLGVPAVADCAVALESPLADRTAVDRLSHIAAMLREEVERRGAHPG